ncbi:protein TRI1-like [Lolium rigidum]|uniref:protein TRI1-like n=1 Tax=Lolium rigidum TaxID=89674 RepID=UPI001F5DC758|nr:protein TRI1-like [Lolium rigidum]
MSSAAARALRGCRALVANSFSSSAAAAGGKRPASAAAAAVKPPKKVISKDDATEAKNLRGIMRPLPVSEALSKFPGGAPEISRAGAIKIVWAYIKGQGLQNPANKREILCDEKLKNLFAGRDKIGMMEITGLLNPHFIKTK